MICAIAASDRRTHVFRISTDRTLEHRWLDTANPEAQWTSWQRDPFRHPVAGVTAISGWEEQIEVFLLDSSGRVWNRWWWQQRGWAPRAAFNPLGTPFAGCEATSITALNAGRGHFNVFVEAANGQIAMLPHVTGPDGHFWLRCTGPEALDDGWWPAFESTSHGAYISTSPSTGSP
jgi:hypothetical protein